MDHNRAIKEKDLRMLAEAFTSLVSFPVDILGFERPCNIPDCPRYAGAYLRHGAGLAASCMDHNLCRLCGHPSQFDKNLCRRCHDEILSGVVRTKCAFPECANRVMRLLPGDSFARFCHQHSQCLGCRKPCSFVDGLCFDCNADATRNARNEGK